MLTLPTSTTCSPLWSTSRTLDRPTDGALVAALARAIGRPLFPWQRAVADLTGERDPATGLPAYSRVVLIAPRRAGKSALMLARALATIRAPNGRAFYTSAHRENAARMWRDDWFPTVERSAIGAYTRLVYGNGSETIAYRKGLGGSTFRLVAPSGAAIRGAATNLVIIDEARELGVDQGDELERAVFPTQATGPGGQTGFSTRTASRRGWPAGATSAARRPEGRAPARLLEYAARRGRPDDEATWWAAHPGAATTSTSTPCARLRSDGPRRLRCEYPLCRITRRHCSSTPGRRRADVAPLDPVASRSRPTGRTTPPSSPPGHRDGRVWSS